MILYSKSSEKLKSKLNTILCIYYLIIIKNNHTIYKLALTRKHIILMMITIKSKKDSGATSKEII